MNWRRSRYAVSFAAVVGAIVLIAADPAAAKGADQATITGPGLSRPIVVGGDGEPGSGDDLAQLSEGSGLFVAMFGPDAGTGQTLSASAPTGALGPKYKLSFRVPDGTTKPPTVTQDLYPLAPAGPVTFTAAGQTVFGTNTAGGWYQATASFTTELRKLGVPTPGVATSPAAATAVAAVAAPPSTHEAVSKSVPWMAIGAGLVGALVIGIALAMLLRRRAIERTE